MRTDKVAGGELSGGAAASYGPALLRILARRIEGGGYVTSNELADALELTGDLPLPPSLLAYLCGRLRTTEPKRRGRKAGGIVAEVRNRLAVIRYQEIYAEMRAEARKSRRKRLRSDPPLSDLAAERVAAELYSRAGGTARNAISKARRGKF